MAVTMKDFNQWEYAISSPWWRVTESGIYTAAIETKRGIVFADIFPRDYYTQLSFVWDGRKYTRTWQTAWGRKTAVRLARKMVEDICADSSLSCRWVDKDDYWETSYGKHWSFIADGPTENGMNYCHNCGRPLVAEGTCDEIL
jgi:hypothetical protein